MRFGFTSPVSGLAPIQIGWSGTLVPLRGTTLADGNDHKSHRESAGFQRQQGSNQTGSESNAKAPASAGRGPPRQVGFSLSLSWDGQQSAQLVGGWAAKDRSAPGKLQKHHHISSSSSLGTSQVQRAAGLSVGAPRCNLEGSIWAFLV